jgi:protocatechuate 3,4-dioxygenase alpha subunit
MTRLGQTPSQTVGPYFSMRLSGAGENVLVAAGDPRRIRVIGSVYDGDGKLVDDALVEIWQADAEGRYSHPADPRHGGVDGAFLGFGRAAIDAATGSYSFETLKPGRVFSPDGNRQSPHINVVVQGRGMLRPSFTRLYFPEDAPSHAEDLILSRVPSERRRSLVAERVPGVDPPSYRFDVRFQGPDETVFFEF